MDDRAEDSAAGQHWQQVQRKLLLMSLVLGLVAIDIN